MALVNVASSLEMSVRMWTPTGLQADSYVIIGTRDPYSPAIHGWGITYGVDDAVYNQWIADNPDAAPFLKLVTQADIDFFSDPANTHGWEIGLAPPPQPGQPPVNLDVPHVSQVTTAVNCTMGNWEGEPLGYSYRWQLNYIDIANTAASYTVLPGDVGKTICCFVTATNNNGATESPMSNAIVVVNPAPINNTAVPVIQQQSGAVVSNTGSWTGSPTSYAYQWKLDGVNAGTNNPSYTIVVPDDVGKTATCTVTAINAFGTTQAPPSLGIVIT